MSKKIQKAEKILSDTGERMIPEYHKGQLMYAEHLTRYLAAQELVQGKVVLDIASGSGYGVKILSQKASFIYGVDVDPDAIAYGKRHYAGKNIEYRQGDGVKIPLEDNSVDIVTTFETIEHIENFHQFLDEVKRVLKPDGLVIISTPNDLEFPEGAHFHVHEFEYQELLRVTKKRFKNIEPFFQATWRYVAVGDATFFEKEWDMPIRTLNLAPLDSSKYLYFFLLCSNRPITEKVSAISATGQHHSDREIIGSWTSTNEELQRRQDRIDELVQLLDKTNDLRDAAEAELATIKQSRSYSLAKKVANAKKIVKRK